jgi:hypothetical protein
MPSSSLASALFATLLLLTCANLVQAQMAGLMKACNDQNATCLRQCHTTLRETSKYPWCKKECERELGRCEFKARHHSQ